MRNKLNVLYIEIQYLYYFISNQRKFSKFKSMFNFDASKCQLSNISRAKTTFTSFQCGGTP